MIKVCTILLLILFCPLMLVAQNDKYACFGLRLGLGASTLTGLDRRTSLPVDKLEDLSSGYRFSWDVGMSLQLGWGDGYVVQTDLLAGMQGAKVKGVYQQGSEVDRISISNMQLAITCGKKIHLNDKVRFIITAGPYLGYDMTSEGNGYSDGNGISDGDYDMFAMTKSATTKSVTINTDDQDIFRRTDFGMMVIAGIETGGVQIAFAPQFGLTNLSENNPKVSHRVYKLALTYYF